jgi:mitochondrial intermembrane space import and assembly protein 40
MHNIPLAPSATPEVSTTPHAPAAVEKTVEADIAAASHAEVATIQDKARAAFPDVASDMVDLSVASGKASDVPVEDDDGSAIVEPGEFPDAAPAAKDLTDESVRRTMTREEEIEEALACPCIDAMRDGPCGDDFISAYRCFLQSDTEPKGMDCVERFSSMQTCMGEHPEHYLDDGPEEGEGAAAFSGKDEPASDAEAVPPANVVSPTPVNMDAVVDSVEQEVAAAVEAVEAVEVAAAEATEAAVRSTEDGTPVTPAPVTEHPTPGAAAA